jgi:hypothetical protein
MGSYIPNNGRTTARCSVAYPSEYVVLRPPPAPGFSTPASTKPLIRRYFAVIIAGIRRRHPTPVAQSYRMVNKRESFRTSPTSDPRSVMPPTAYWPTLSPYREEVSGGVMIEIPSEKLSRISTARMVKPEMLRRSMQIWSDPRQAQSWS